MRVFFAVVLISAVVAVPTRLQAQEGPSPTIATAISGGTLVVTGLAVGVGSMFYDVFTVGDAAREERAVRMEATVSPRGLGLSVRLAF